MPGHGVTMRRARVTAVTRLLGTKTQSYSREKHQPASVRGTGQGAYAIVFSSSFMNSVNRTRTNGFLRNRISPKHD